MASAAIPISRREITLRRWLSRGQDAALLVVAAVFVWFHSLHVIQHGSYTSLFFAVEQTILIAIFLGRRHSASTSARPMDWMTATIGGWFALAMQPQNSEGALAALGTGLQIGGLMLTIVAFVTIGRSFGVVAADRGLKTAGPYRVVRHPIYLSHTVTQIGFLTANLVPLNAAILICVWICQIARIHAEERVLEQTSDYHAYAKRVRWRLVPGLY